MSIKKRILLMFAAVVLLGAAFSGTMSLERMVLCSHSTQLHLCWVPKKMRGLHFHLRVE